MRKTIFFILGFCSGVCVCVMLMFALSTLLNLFSIQLYDSELDQQRNFNFFVIASLFFGLISGVFTSKRFAR